MCVHMRVFLCQTCVYTYKNTQAYTRDMFCAFCLSYCYCMLVVSIHIHMLTYTGVYALPYQQPVVCFIDELNRQIHVVCLCFCVCLCVFVSVYIHIHIYVYMYTYILFLWTVGNVDDYLQLNMLYVYVCMYVCIYVCMYTYKCK